MRCAERGYSLVETMIGLALTGLLMTGAVSWYQAYYREYQERGRRIEAQQGERVGMGFLIREFGNSGFGVPYGTTAVIEAEPAAFTVLTNLNGVTTTLKKSAQAGEQEIRVASSGDFEEGDRISLCNEERCELNHIKKIGEDSLWTLEESLLSAYPLSSPVGAIDELRYYLSASNPENRKLIRRKNGGSNTVTEGVLDLRFEYFDDQGQPTDSPDRIRKLKITLSVGVPGFLEFEPRRIVRTLHLPNL
jgi:type II secretory pathway pseudopilin PulG